MSTNSTESNGIHSPLTLTQDTISNSSIMFICNGCSSSFHLAVESSDMVASERFGAEYNRSVAGNKLRQADYNRRDAHNILVVEADGNDQSCK